MSEYFSLYILYIDVDVLCMPGIYCRSVCPQQRDPPSVALPQISSFSKKGFIRFFLTRFEGLSTESVERPEANSVCNFGLQGNWI